MNLSSMIEIPGMRRTTSPASRSCVRAIICFDTPLTTILELRTACITAASLESRRTVVTTTSSISSAEGCSEISGRVFSPGLI